MLNDHDYFEFTANVTSAAVQMGTAVEFVVRTDGNSIPLVKAAAADTDERDGTPRTTYVGVAMQSGAVGDLISCRVWAAGTMPAFVDTAVDLEAGTDLFWNGSAFVIVDPAVTSYTTTSVTNNGSDEVYIGVSGAGWVVDEHAGKEIKITSGEHSDEHFLVFSNTPSTLTLHTVDIYDWTSPIDFDMTDNDEETWSKRTALNMSKIPGNASPQICELLILKGGRT